jgi:hypothetical protein
MTKSEVTEMWLHVRTPEGTWRRYPMETLDAPGGTVGVVVFPSALLDKSGHAPYYVSASTRAGDDYFTEDQNRSARLVDGVDHQVVAPSGTVTRSRSS